MRIAGSQVDIDSIVEIGDRQYEILVEAKADGSPSAIRRAARQLKSIRRSFADVANIYLAVGAPYISDKAMEVCEEEHVDLDEFGDREERDRIKRDAFERVNAVLDILKIGE